MVNSEEFPQKERNFRIINVIQKAYNLDFCNKYHCCDTFLGYSFQKVNHLRKRARHSWPLCNTLSGHGSLQSAIGQAEEGPINTTQALGAPGRMQCLFSWNSMGSTWSILKLQDITEYVVWSFLFWRSEVQPCPWSGALTFSSVYEESTTEINAKMPL